MKNDVTKFFVKLNVNYSKLNVNYSPESTTKMMGNLRIIQNGANLANLSGMCHQGNVSET